MAKLKETRAGDILGDGRRRLSVPPLQLPAPVMAFSYEPKTKGDEDKAATAVRRLSEEDPTLDVTPGALGQLREGNRLSWRARNATRLGVRDEDGRLAGITMLYSDGRVAQVEDVYVIPEARGRGHARRLVTRAVELALGAGHELTFIVADDNDWPKQLYRRLGFEFVGRTFLFHRER